MKKNLLRRVFNRWLHLLARFSPGATSLRPFLHKLRGMKIHGSVWIGEEAYIENEYPEDVEIHDGACVSMRATILAHTRGSGRIIIARNAFIGPGAMVICSSGRTLRIGEGAAVSAGAVVMSSVPAGVVIAPPALQPRGPGRHSLWHRQVGRRVHGRPGTLETVQTQTRQTGLRDAFPPARKLRPAGPLSTSGRGEACQGPALF